MNRLTTPSPTTVAGGTDAGRTILEAVIALALIAIAVISWGRMSVSSAQTEARVGHREIALELATNTLEQLRVRPWDAVAVDPASLGSTRRFEGNATTHDPSGVAAEVTAVRNGIEFLVVTHVTESGDSAWRNAVVIIEWGDGERRAELRLDSAMRRPDDGTAS